MPDVTAHQALMGLKSNKQFQVELSVVNNWVSSNKTLLSTTKGKSDVYLMYLTLVKNYLSFYGVRDRAVIKTVATSLFDSCVGVGR